MGGREEGRGRERERERDYLYLLCIFILLKVLFSFYFLTFSNLPFLIFFHFVRTVDVTYERRKSLQGLADLRLETIPLVESEEENVPGEEQSHKYLLFKTHSSTILFIETCSLLLKTFFLLISFYER